MALPGAAVDVSESAAAAITGAARAHTVRAARAGVAHIADGADAVVVVATEHRVSQRCRCCRR